MASGHFLMVTGWGYDTQDLPVPNAKLEAKHKDFNPQSPTFGMPQKEIDVIKHDNPKLFFLNHHYLNGLYFLQS